jgi:hypothetical protein
MLLVGPAASAQGAAKVRFVQAIPGPGEVTLEATAGGITERIGSLVGFGKVSRYVNVPAGEVTFELHRDPAPDTAKETLRNGAHYTVAALSRADQPLLVLQDGDAARGKARLRVVHAAAELGRVDVQLGDRTVADGVGSGAATGYTTVEPGAYALNVTRPGGGSPIAARGAVPLTAGTSATAFVVGTGGEPVQVVVASDRMAAPRGAPATGLGGLAGEDSDTLLALIAGFLAALAGAVAYVALTARSRRGGP